jgi:hypothetical protein
MAEVVTRAHPDAELLATVDRVQAAMGASKQAVVDGLAALDVEPSLQAERRALWNVVERQNELIGALIELLKMCTREPDEERGKGERGPAAG